MNITTRERFRNCVRFGKIDRPPRWEWCIRSDTAERWRNEGLPPEVPEEKSWTEFFGFDRGGGYANSNMAEKLDVQVHPLPSIGGETVEEDAATVVLRNNWGGIQKLSKFGQSVPQYLSFGVKTSEDFRKTIKPRLNPADPARYPQDWEERKTRWRTRDYPICAWTYGWYGLLRELMGVEELSVAFYENPALIDEISEHWGDYLIQMFTKAFREIDVDYILFWEDLAFKTAPLLSPQHFRRHFLPHYRRVTDALRQAGTDIFAVDSDGNIDSIIPLWIEGGINMLAPFEVTAGMDVVKVGRDYPKEFAIVGGLDKMEIAKGPQAIEAEITRKVEPLLKRGGYIPTLDHAVHPEISYRDFRYYRDFLKKVCG